MGILVYRDRLGSRDLVGRIEYVRGVSASFCYDKDYLSRAKTAGELGISERLPLDDAPYGLSAMSPFFQGLLPKGAVRDNLAQIYQVPRGDYLGLIEQLGCESIGALTFVSESVDGEEYEPRYEPMTERDFAQFRENSLNAVTIKTSETRLSLSGAQSKVAWYLPPGVDPGAADAADWLVPRGTAPSNYIIKVSRPGEEKLALNERVCSMLALSCGIETVRVVSLPNLPGAIAVERYDRRFVESQDGTILMRLHQEDFCQALGLAPYLKYQPQSGEGEYIVYAANLIDAASANPHVDRVELAKRIVFNYAIGNSDAHLKNSSLLYNPEWTSRRLAPMYDVTCIPLTGYFTRMAFTVGKHRLLEEVDENDIMAIALDMGISLDEFDAAIREIVNGFASFELHDENAATQETAEAIERDCASRLKVLKGYLG